MCGWCGEWGLKCVGGCGEWGLKCVGGYGREESGKCVCVRGHSERNRKV